MGMRCVSKYCQQNASVIYQLVLLDKSSIDLLLWSYADSMCINVSYLIEDRASYFHKLVSQTVS